MEPYARTLVWMGDSLTRIRGFPKADIQLIRERLRRAKELARERER